MSKLSGASQLRFWGKIYGITADYFVVEGTLPKAEEKTADPTIEKRGVGVNRYVYWVTDNLLDDWVQLPDAKAEHIQAARQIKHLMTGDLNAAIDSNPLFPGKERHLLRAQIARITAATIIIPKGLYEMDEETGEMKFAEEFAVPGTDDLKSLETWGHMHPLILKAGRVSHFVPSTVDEEGKDEYLEKLNTADPTVDRFRAIQEDAPIAIHNTAWLTKLAGDTQSYNQPPPKEGTTSYAINVLKSLRWPGALTVSKGGKFASIYLGNGVKRGDVCFSPTEPPEV